MVAAKKTASPAVAETKPHVALVEGVARWIPAEEGELRLGRKPTPGAPDGIALCRAFLQGVIDCHPSGEAEGCGEIEAFADKTAKRFPLTGNLLTDSAIRPRARELVTAFADAWTQAEEEAYHRGRQDEREGC